MDDAAPLAATAPVPEALTGLENFVCVLQRARNATCSVSGPVRSAVDVFGARKWQRKRRSPARATQTDKQSGVPSACRRASVRIVELQRRDRGHASGRDSKSQR